jgi:hypothetical protein
LAEGCEALYGRSVEADLSQVGLIIVLTGERKSLVNWIEQVGSQTGIPVVAGTTQSLEPVALSYMTSGQLEGVLSHSAAMGRYEDVLSEAAADTADQRIITAQVLTQLLLVVVLLISLVWQISRSNRSRKQ